MHRNRSSGRYSKARISAIRRSRPGASGATRISRWAIIRIGNVVSAEITYANNLDRIETIRSDGRIDGADPSIAALTGRIEVRFADQTLVTQAINGDPCEMEFAYVLPSGESFIFTVHAVHLPRPRTRSPGRRACRPLSTGRPRATAWWAGCVPQPS